MLVHIPILSKWHVHKNNFLLYIRGIEMRGSIRMYICRLCIRPLNYASVTIERESGSSSSRPTTSADQG